MAAGPRVGLARARQGSKGRAAHVSSDNEGGGWSRGQWRPDNGTCVRHPVPATTVSVVKEMIHCWFLSVTRTVVLRCYLPSETIACPTSGVPLSDALVDAATRRLDSCTLHDRGRAAFQLRRRSDKQAVQELWVHSFWSCLGNTAGRQCLTAAMLPRCASSHATTADRLPRPVRDLSRWMHCRRVENRHAVGVGEHTDHHHVRGLRLNAVCYPHITDRPMLESFAESCSSTAVIDHSVGRAQLSV